jgi:hypothetical protein
MKEDLTINRKIKIKEFWNLTIKFIISKARNPYIIKIKARTIFKK